MATQKKATPKTTEEVGTVNVDDLLARIAALENQKLPVQTTPRKAETKSYLSSFRGRMISMPNKYVPLGGGVNEKLQPPPIQFRGGLFTTSDPDVQEVIESQPDFSLDAEIGDSVNGHVISIVPQRFDIKKSRDKTVVVQK